MSIESFKNRLVLKDEKNLERSVVVIDYKKRLIEVVAVNQSKDKVKVYMRSVFDLSNLSMKEILVHAAKNLLIRWFRKQYTEETQSTVLLNETDKVYDINNFRPIKKTKSRVDQAKALLAKLSEEERKEVIG